MSVHTSLEARIHEVAHFCGIDLESLPPEIAKKCSGIIEFGVSLHMVPDSGGAHGK